MAERELVAQNLMEGLLIMGCKQLQSLWRSTPGVRPEDLHFLASPQVLLFLLNLWPYVENHWAS